MKTTNDIFKGSDASLTEVIILPVGSHGAGSYSLPAGDLWTDYESVEIVGVYNGSLRAYATISKEFIITEPTSFEAQLLASTDTSSIFTLIKATSVSTFDISIVVSTMTISYIKAYKKKYTTRNLSKTVSVNGGADIAINSRYEIDIATMLGSEYLNRDLVVEVEIYASGTNYTGWGKVGGIDYITSSTMGAGYSVKGNGTIEVYTGSAAIVFDSPSVINVWGNASSILSAPCRVKVWKVDEYLPATRSSGDITTIWTGSAGHGANPSWSLPLSGFDAIMVKGSVDVGGSPFQVSGISEGIMGYAEWVATSGSITHQDAYNFVIRLSNIMETRATVYAQNGTSAGTVVLTGIYGINYS